VIIIAQRSTLAIPDQRDRPEVGRAVHLSAVPREASKDGAPQHPGWSRNILANPEVEVQVGTAKMKARARTAAADYQKKTEGEIPVLVPDAR
jgi:hypothetical protein